MLLYLRYDIHTRSYNNAIRLLGDNDYEFSSKSSNRPVVEIDGCKVRSLIIEYANQIIYGTTHFANFDKLNYTYFNYSFPKATKIRVKNCFHITNGETKPTSCSGLLSGRLWASASGIWL